MADTRRWLVLVYRVPSEPSRLRATVWRRLKAVGAVYLANSVATLPASPTAERSLRTLRNEIVEMGGTAQLLRAQALDGERDVIRTFNAARDEEYVEIIDRCRDFLVEIETETATDHFTYAELEENDEDLLKLRGWLEKVRARDVLGARRSDEADAALAQCTTALEGFAERVYRSNAEAARE
ncbi:MAG: Chromate resistance protein ChrB [Candidatus Dormibacteraceae bacterium]